MITIQQEAMHNLLEIGKALSTRNGQTTLVSMVKQVNVADPLVFFESGRHYFNGQRSFWSDPDREMILVGLGAAYTIRTGEMNRYKNVEREWRGLLEDVLIERQEQIIGTGPILMGGFSFDPLKRKTKLWSEFDHSKFVLPKVLLTVWKGQAYLTTNVFVSDKTDVEQLAQALSNIEQQLLMDGHEGLVNPYDHESDSIRINEVEPEQWKQAVAKLAAEVREQKLDKVVLARELRIQSDKPFSPDAVLARLREEQPLSYLFAIETGGDCFLGASPERLVKRSGDEVLSTCLAGSIRRGNTPAEDEQLGQALLQDKKNLHEHAVVVEMIKSAMEKGCVVVDVPEHPVLITLRNIHHLYTPVKGQAREDVSLLGMVDLLHPTPALGGFPKEVALTKIREEELLDRGWYAGPVGWIDSFGNGEFAVAIRSGLLQGQEASLFAGCGIVGDSDPESEYQETIIKFKPMLSALGGKMA